MTKKEALQVLAILKAAYPNSYKGMTAEEATGTVSMWVMQFNDMPADIVLMAVHKAISVCKFPPSIAEVKEKIKHIHWEARDELYVNYGNKPKPTPQETEYFKRIYEATRQYNHDRPIEPELKEMAQFASKDYMRIEGAYNE